MNRRLATLGCLMALVASGCAGKGSVSPATPPATPATTPITPTAATPSPGTAASPSPGLPSPTATPSPAATSSPAVGPPSGATARSITFISASQAWVLAGVPGTKRVVLRTTDRGAHWSLVGPINDVTAPTSEIRFADASNGWAYGPGLYATHDGGAHWTAVAQPGPVLSLEAAGGNAWAVVASCTPGAQPCAAPDRLLRAPVGGDAWHEVAAGLPASTTAQLALHQNAVFAYAGGPSAVLAQAQDGAHFTGVHSPCTGDLALSGIALASATNLDVVCSGNGAAGSSTKQVWGSSDAGGTFHKLADAPLGGQFDALADASGTTIVMAAASGASELYRTAGTDTHWATVLTLADGGAGWSDLGFTNADQGAVISGPQNGAGAIYLTDDGGATWHRSALSP